MCRWNAYFGQPVAIDELLFKTDHGLIDQSLHARMGVETTNGDGFGLGWYGANDGRPGATAASRPAWSDVNLRELAAHIESPLFLAHIRATTGTPVQQTNCHPFRQGRWLFVHNGVIAGFQEMRRELLLAVDPRCSRIAGSRTPKCSSTSRSPTASRTTRWARWNGPSDSSRRPGARTASNTHPDDVGISNGERLWAIRYSSQHQSRTLFVSQHADTLRQLHPDNPRLQRFTEERSRRRLRTARRPPRSMARHRRIHRTDHPTRCRRTTTIPAPLAVDADLR